HFEDIAERSESVRLWRTIADDRRRRSRVFARAAAASVGVDRRPIHHDDHRQGRRHGIRVGEGMAAGAEVPEANSPRRPRHDASWNRVGADSRSGTPLVLVLGTTVLGLVLSQRRYQGTYFAADGIAHLPDHRTRSE